MGALVLSAISVETDRDTVPVSYALPPAARHITCVGHIQKHKMYSKSVISNKSLGSTHKVRGK